MFRYLRKRREIRRTMNELQKLNDRDLYDIGISRCDIPLVAKGLLKR